MSSGATIVYDSVKESSGLEDGTLFEGLSFWIALRVPMRQHYIELIQVNGGAIVMLEKKADHLIVDHARPNGMEGGLSYRFIEASIKNGQLADPDDHAVGRRKGSVREIGSSRITSGRRNAYTAEDDLNIYRWVKDTEARGGSIAGNKIYQQYEQINPRHPWQSWRDRFVKHLSHKPPAGYTPSTISPPLLSPRREESRPSESNARQRDRKERPQSSSDHEIDTNEQEESLGEETVKADGRRTETSRRMTKKSLSAPRFSRRKSDSSDSEASVRARLGQYEYWELYIDADSISRTEYYEYDEGWYGWAKDAPEYSAKEWRKFWEKVVFKDWKKDGRQDPEMREAKVARFRKLKAEYKSSQSQESQNAVLGHFSSQQASPIQMEVLVEQPPEQLSQKRLLGQFSLDAEIHEMQSQDQEPPHKRARSEAEAQSQTFDLPSGIPNTSDLQPTQIDVVERDEDSEEEIGETYLEKAFPDEIFGHDQASDDSQLPREAAQLEESATLIASQLGETVNESGSAHSTGLTHAEILSDDESDSLFVTDRRPAADLDNQPALSSSHEIPSSSQEIPDLSVALPDEGLDHEIPSEDDNDEDDAASDTPTPKRPVYDTQAILEADTQYPDLGLPEPPDDLEDGLSQRSRASSVDTTLSEHPLDVAGIQDLFSSLTARGFSKNKIIEILKCTSNYRRLADIVVQSVDEGHGVPDDVPGIWTEEDDDALDSGNGRDIKRLEDKHGWGRVEERVEFLKHWRS